MTACTELRPAAARDGLVREGQKGMRSAAARDGLVREGQKGMPEVGTA